MLTEGRINLCSPRKCTAARLWDDSTNASQQLDDIINDSQELNDIISDIQELDCRYEAMVLQ